MLDVLESIMGGLLPMLNALLRLVHRAYVLSWNVTGDSVRSSHRSGSDRAGSFMMMLCEAAEIAMAKLRTAVGAATAALASDLIFEMM
jgi:hypothetical protein